MVKFREYIISRGDTMQYIAQRELGDMNKWVELAKFNNLRYPYIVDTVEEKLQDLDHLVTIGDTILLRTSEDDKARLISSLKRMNEYDKEEIYAVALGKDLDILPITVSGEAQGRNEEVLALKPNSKGQIATVTGVDNLKQALLIRLLTPMGSYLGHPNYGSLVHKYIGRKNTAQNAILLNIEIERTLRTDGRVEDVELINYRIKNNTYAVHFRISASAIDEAFDFVLSSRNGILQLENDYESILS